MTRVALLNAPEDLAVARKVLLMIKERLEKAEHALTHSRMEREQYIDKFARADELRAALEQTERFVAQKERET